MSRLLRIEVTVPPQYEDVVEQDLARRGATVTRRDAATLLKGEIPSDAIEHYGTELRALTAGLGTYRAYTPESAT